MEIGCIFPEMGAYRLHWICCVLLFFCCTATRVCGQSNTAILERTVKFQQRSVRLDTLLQTITRQTGIRFSYNSRRLNTSYRLRIQTNTITVRQALDELKNSTGVLYTVIENQVILNIEKSTVQQPIKEEAKPPEVQPKPDRRLSTGVTANVQNSAKEVQSTRVELSGDSLKIPEDSVLVRPDSVTHTASALLPVSDSVKTINQPSVRVPDQSKIDSTNQKTKALPIVKKGTSKKQKYFIDVGVSAEETLFMGATLQGGVPAIFASVSVKSNGQSVILLYGLGTSLRIREKSRILLSAQYGSYSKAFTRTEINPMDTTAMKYDIGVTGSWGRAGVGMEWKLRSKSNWKFYSGLNFNVLESRYTVNGKKSGLGVLSASDPEQTYSAFYPFYTITNTYEDTAANAVKTWIGVQVGISYTIFYR